MVAGKPKIFGFVIKHSVPRATKLAIEVADWLEKKKCQVIVADESDTFIAKRKKTKSATKVVMMMKMHLLFNLLQDKKELFFQLPIFLINFSIYFYLYLYIGDIFVIKIKIECENIYYSLY